ncbi:MAG: hypothetical protein ACYDBH_14105 [Acidobacteriaceae bacterium]
MLNESKSPGVAPDLTNGTPCTTGGVPGEFKRWSAGRRNEVVLHLLGGEPVDAAAYEVPLPVKKPASWRDRTLTGTDAGLKERANDASP